MSVRQIFRVALAAVALVVAGQPSQAAFIVGSTNFNFGGPDTTPNAQDLNTATGFVFRNPVVNGADRFGDFFTQLSPAITGTASPLTLTSASATATLMGTFTIDFSPIAGPPNQTFTATSGSVISRTMTPGRTLNLFLSGLIQFSGYEATPGQAVLGFTQVSDGTAISGSGTLTAFPPVTLVPLPPTLVLAAFGGVGLAGLRGVRRRVARS